MKIHKSVSSVFKYSKRHLTTYTSKPDASKLLTCYLQARGEPEWTSYFVKWNDVHNDQWGMSHFNWKVGASNYHVLRIGCFPYIKYHCTKREYTNLKFEDLFFRAIKLLNLGIPCLMYGIAAIFLIRHKEIVQVDHFNVSIYFLMKEIYGAKY